MSKKTEIGEVRIWRVDNGFTLRTRPRHSPEDEVWIATDEAKLAELVKRLFLRPAPGGKRD